ncbi:MAG: amino acid permease, partial [Methanoregula sp.]|nr:amino acid permease [Methanoregula sp.]
HPTFHTPVKVTLLVGLVTATLAAFLPLDLIAELVNIGTLAAFIIVAFGILMLRKVQPDAERPFRCPLMPWIPLLCIVSSTCLILMLPTVTQLRFVIWMAAGLCLYFLFGQKNSYNKGSSTGS